MERIGNNIFDPKVAILKDVKKGYAYFADGDIVMAKVTPCFENGNIALVDNLVNGIGFGTSEFYVFRCFDINNKFLLFFLQNHIFKKLGKQLCMEQAD